MEASSIKKEEDIWKIIIYNGLHNVKILGYKKTIDN